MKTIRLLRAGAAALCLTGATLAAQAAAYDTNLVVNGDAEQGLAGWTAYAGYGSFASAAYGSNWVLPTQPGPADRGANLFVGGSGLATALGWQAVDVSANAAAINAGTVSFDLSGWLGGWSNQGDNAQFVVNFMDAGANSLGTVTLGPVTAADRGNATGLLFRETTGLVPAGTTQLRFDLVMTRLASSDNDGYADNLSFTMAAAPVPEPGTTALLAAGLGLVGFVATRRRQRRG